MWNWPLVLQKKNADKALLFRMICMDNKPLPANVDFGKLLVEGAVDGKLLSGIGRNFPVLVIAGSEDLWWSVDSLKEVAEHLCASFKVCNGVGHNPAFEDPKQFNQILDESLEQKKSSL